MLQSQNSGWTVKTAERIGGARDVCLSCGHAGAFAQMLDRSNVKNVDAYLCPACGEVAATFRDRLGFRAMLRWLEQRVRERERELFVVASRLSALAENAADQPRMEPK